MDLKSKKGQVTVFIILGITILLFSSVIFWLSSTGAVEGLETEVAQGNIDTASVNIFVEACLEQVTEEAIYFVAKQGGYYELPEMASVDAYENTAYYLSLGYDFSPKIEVLEESLSLYVEKNILECTNFSVFPSFEISSGTPVVEADVLGESVKVMMNLPLVIVSFEGEKANIETFIVELDSRLGLLYSIALEINQIQKEEGEYVCISCLYLMGLEHSVDVFTVDGDEGTMFVIYDLLYESDIIEEDLTFRFLHDYYEQGYSYSEEEDFVFDDGTDVNYGFEEDEILDSESVLEESS